MGLAKVRPPSCPSPSRVPRSSTTSTRLRTSEPSDAPRAPLTQCCEALRVRGTPTAPRIQPSSPRPWSCARAGSASHRWSRCRRGPRFADAPHQLRVAALLCRIGSRKAGALFRKSCPSSSIFSLTHRKLLITPCDSVLRHYAHLTC